MVLKGAFFLHEFSSKFRDFWLGLRLNIIIKNPGINKLAKMVRDKAGERIITYNSTKAN